jgi:hypothetical protein
MQQKRHFRTRVVRGGGHVPLSRRPPRRLLSADSVEYIESMPLRERDAV